MVASVTWDALGTWCEVLTVHDDDLPELAELARDRMDAVEAACSRPGCELAGLARGRAQRISPTLSLALAASLRTAEFTTGLVAPAPGWRTVSVDPREGTVVVPEDVQLDLGVGVRAWAADWIADACATDLGVGCLVNLGGDIAVRGEVPAGGWQVEIDDGHPGPLGRPVISMGWPGGLATASADTGAWRTVTVAARNTERAYAAAAAALTLGDSAPRWLTQRELPARLVHTGGVVVQTNGWPQQRWIA